MDEASAEAEQKHALLEAAPHNRDKQVEQQKGRHVERTPKHRHAEHNRESESQCESWSLDESEMQRKS